MAAKKKIVKTATVSEPTHTRAQRSGGGLSEPTYTRTQIVELLEREGRAALYAASTEAAKMRRKNAPPGDVHALIAAYHFTASVHFMFARQIATRTIAIVPPPKGSPK